MLCRSRPCHDPDVPVVGAGSETVPAFFFVPNVGETHGK